MSSIVPQYPIVVLPRLAVALGDLDQAVILQQIAWWQERSEHEHDGRKWVYNTADQWQEQFPWLSVWTVRRKLAALETAGYLITGNFNKAGYDRTKWYSVNYGAIARADLFYQSEQVAKMDVSKLPTSISATCSHPSWQNAKTNTTGNTDTTISTYQDALALAFPTWNRDRLIAAAVAYKNANLPAGEIVRRANHLRAQWEHTQYNVTPDSLKRNWERTKTDGTGRKQLPTADDLRRDWLGDDAE